MKMEGLRGNVYHFKARYVKNSTLKLLEFNFRSVFENSFLAVHEVLIFLVLNSLRA